MPSDAPFGGAAVIAYIEIGGELFSRLFQAQIEQSGGEIYHIAVCAVAEAVIPLIHFHAGYAVIVGNAAGHSRAVDGNAILSAASLVVMEFSTASNKSILPPNKKGTCQCRGDNGKGRFCSLLKSHRKRCPLLCSWSRSACQDIQYPFNQQVASPCVRPSVAENSRTI